MLSTPACLIPAQTTDTNQTVNNPPVSLQLELHQDLVARPRPERGQRGVPGLPAQLAGAGRGRGRGHLHPADQGSQADHVSS